MTVWLAYSFYSMHFLHTYKDTGKTHFYQSTVVLAFQHLYTWYSAEANFSGSNRITSDGLRMSTSVLFTIDDEASLALNLSPVETDSWDIENLVVLKVIVAESIWESLIRFWCLWYQNQAPMHLQRGRRGIGPWKKGKNYEEKFLFIPGSILFPKANRISHFLFENLLSIK